MTRILLCCLAVVVTGGLANAQEHHVAKVGMGTRALLQHIEDPDLFFNYRARLLDRRYAALATRAQLAATRPYRYSSRLVVVHAAWPPPWFRQQVAKAIADTQAIADNYGQ